MPERGDSDIETPMLGGIWPTGWLGYLLLKKGGVKRAAELR
jgi:hypothetical protein